MKKERFIVWLLNLVNLGDNCVRESLQGFFMKRGGGDFVGREEERVGLEGENEFL